jgi:hypothetical protein
MSLRSRYLATAVIVSLALAVAAGGAVAPADTGRAAAAASITPTRVDGVRVGDTFSHLRDRGLIGRLRPGCEFGGPDTRSARLRAPLQGQVNFTLTTPRKVTDISVRGGAKARGVGIGARIPKILANFPRAVVDHSTEDVFRLTLVRTPRRNSGARITFGVSTVTGRTTIIGVPRIAFCE